jgi:hypothetical protein
MRGLGFVVVLVLLAGCLSGNGGSDDGEDEPHMDPPFPFVPPEPDFDFTTIVDPDHGAHEVPQLHAASHGLTLVGHVGMQELVGPTVRGSITQVDVWGDWAVVSGMEGGVAFILVDISDRTDPQAVSWYPSTADGWTARFSDDGNYVFYGCQTLGPLNPQSSVQGTCEDPEALHAPGEEGNGVIVVNVTDREDPRFVDFLPLQGSHNIFVTSINGTDLVITEATEIVGFDRAAGRLELLSEVQGVHDATVARHPVTGVPYLFVGAGEMSIYDLSDPTLPQLVYEGTGEEGWTGWHEQTVVPGLVDGRWVVALAGESFVGTGGETLPDAVDIVNITDPSQPELLGSWTPPFAPATPWVSYLFSIHEMAATPTGQVAVAWYHGGVWVLDVSTQARQEGPITLAGYQPNMLMNVVPATFAQVPIPVVPFVWGAGWTSDGYLVVPDMHTGLYILEPDWGLIPGADGGQ